MSDEEFFIFKRIPLADRQRMFDQVKPNLSTHIPLIIEEKLKNFSETQFIENPTIKLLVEVDNNLGHVIKLLKNRLPIKPECSIFLLIQGKIALSLSKSLKEIYEKYKDDDGFLYIIFSYEMFWG